MLTNYIKININIKKNYSYKMEVCGQTTNINIKIFEIKEGEDKFKCEMQIIKNFLQVTLYLEDKVK